MWIDFTLYILHPFTRLRLRFGGTFFLSLVCIQVSRGSLTHEDAPLYFIALVYITHSFLSSFPKYTSLRHPTWTMYPSLVYSVAYIALATPCFLLRQEGGRKDDGRRSISRVPPLLQHRRLCLPTSCRSIARTELYKYAPLYRPMLSARRNTENRIDTENESRRVHIRTRPALSLSLSRFPPYGSIFLPLCIYPLNSYFEGNSSCAFPNWLPCV